MREGVPARMCEKVEVNRLLIGLCVSVCVLVMLCHLLSTSEFVCICVFVFVCVYVCS